MQSVITAQGCVYLNSAPGVYSTPYLGNEVWYYMGNKCQINFSSQFDPYYSTGLCPYGNFLLGRC